MPSPAQPTAPLTPRELSECVERLRGSAWKPIGGGPILLAYATGVSQNWLLARSAALHGVPLVLAGLGRRGWQWYQGGGGKLLGTARALQLLEVMAPDVPIVFADGGDTVIANRWSQAAADRVRGDAGVLTGGECNSWPLCYNRSYLLDARFRACVAEHPTCYPNSGTYLGRAGTLLAFVRALRATMNWMHGRGYAGQLAAERGDDQSAVHHFYLNGRGLAHTMAGAAGAADAVAAAAREIDLRIDGGNDFFLSLFACSGPGGYKLRGRGPFEYCHERAFDAMPHVRAVRNGSGLVWRGSRADTADDAPLRRPFLLHANGKHYRLSDRALAPLMRRLAGAEVTARAEDHPVLLIDSVARGVCGVASLGRVVRGAANRTVAPER